jgi:uncharacterized surface protein with fasciclin (FAS1) repeats
MVGGAVMYLTKSIVENAANWKDHMTLIATIKTGGLVDTLNGKGSFHSTRPYQLGL